MISLTGAQKIQFSEPPAEHRGQFRLDEPARPGHVGGGGVNLTDLHSHDPEILSAGSAITGRFGPASPCGCMRAPEGDGEAGRVPEGRTRPAQMAALFPAGSYGAITILATQAPPALPGRPRTRVSVRYPQAPYLVLVT